MAWLEQESSGHFHIAFRMGSKKFKRSLRTKDEREAEARRQRLEENYRLVESGRLEIPENCDVAAFLLSDGKLNESPKPSRTISLGKLPEAYIESLPNDALEPNTVRIARLHMRHVTRILGARRTVCSVEFEDLQRYVTKRSREPGKRGCVSAGTIKKELSTFSTMWTWSFDRGFVGAAFPKKGLKYPKREQPLPFQTWSQIERQIRQGQLPEDDQESLWNCLYLSLSELSELLADLKSAATADFLAPMCTMAAHTGARRSELCRARVADFDFEEQTIRIRERKRSRGTRTTRTVPMTPHLAETMRAWFDEKSRSPFAFPEEHRVARVRKTQQEEGCASPDEATHHFNQTLADTKWSNVKGWHVFRHSFISNCAVMGVDQRMIDAWVGHQTDEMRRRYTHLFPDAQLATIAHVFGV